MKRRFLTFISLTVATLLPLLAPSCSGLATPSAPDAPESSDSQRYTLSGSFTMPNSDAAPAELSQQNSNQRNAIPDISGLTYTVEAVRSDGHRETTTAVNFTYAFTNLTAGTWQITAYAKLGETCVMQSETETVTLSKSKPDASTSLAMEPASGRGEIDLTVSWTNDSGIGYCEWAFSGSGSLSPSGTSTTSPITIRSSSVASGTHPLTLKFYTSQINANNGSKPLYSCTEYVSVYAGLETNSWTSDTAQHLGAGFSVTKECVETFVYRTIYVKQGADDSTATGTTELPFGTIEKAMERLNEVAANGIRASEISETTPWEMHVTGTPTPPSSISGNGLIDATSTIKFLKIVGDGDGAKIDANEKGRILYVQNGAKVSMQNIELTKGKATGDIGGGGVCVASGGSFTMESGSIKSCTTTSGSGGGIYSEGNLTIRGGTISGNTVGSGVMAANGSVDITGGSIKGNTATVFGNNISIDSSTSITNLPSGNSSFYDDNTSPANGNPDAICTASGHCFSRFNVPSGSRDSIDTGLSIFTDDATIYLGQTTDSADLTWQSNPNIASSCTQNLTIKPTKDGRKATILNHNTSAVSDKYLIHYNASGKTLTLTNLILDGNSKTCGIAKILAGSMTATNCTFQNGGNVTNGAGINIASSNSSVTLESGTLVTGNTANNKGGGIYCNQGNLTINGGTISSNTITSTSISDGGIGIFTVGGSLTMTGGEISSNNQTTSGYFGRGGGLRMNDGTIFTMSGGKITNNHNMGHGANIYTQNAQITLSGTAEISYGTMDTSTLSDSGADAIGGAMYLEGGSTSLIMTGGEIFGNSVKAKRNACAGLWIFNGASFTMTGGRIYNNDNESWGGSSLGGAINFRGGGTFSISGSASIPGGVNGTTGPGKNDVYLDGTSKITITDDLTAATPIATITPAGYPGEGSIVSRQVLDGSEDLLSDNYDKFAVTPQSDGTVWLTNSTGYLRKETLTAADFTSASLIESYKDLMTTDGSSFYADSLADMEGKTLLLWTNYDYYEAGASVNADVYVAVTFSQINGTSFIMTFRAYKNDSSIANINNDYDLGDYETNDDFYINETGYLTYDDVGGEGIIYIGNDAPYAVSTGLGGAPGESGFYLIE